MNTIDFNADVGEGLNNEHLILPYLQSCSIACGGHAGTIETMKNVVGLAAKHKVKIGAHPSYPDKLNFGRKAMVLSENDLYQSLQSQIDDLVHVSKGLNSSLNHIKPHGALYNEVAKNQHLAELLVGLMKSSYAGLKLYAPFNSVIAEVAQRNAIEVVYEAFADRSYTDNLNLVSRDSPFATLKTKESVLAQVELLIKKKQLKTMSGKLEPIQAETICFHTDYPKAVDVIAYVAEKVKSRC